VAKEGERKGAGVEVGGEVLPKEAEMDEVERLVGAAQRISARLSVVNGFDHKELSAAVAELEEMGAFDESMDDCEREELREVNDIGAAQEARDDEDEDEHDAEDEGDVEEEEEAMEEEAYRRRLSERGSPSRDDAGGEAGRVASEDGEKGCLSSGSTSMDGAAEWHECLHVDTALVNKEQRAVAVRSRCPSPLPLHVGWSVTSRNSPPLQLHIPSGPSVVVQCSMNSTKEEFTSDCIASLEVRASDTWNVLFWH
jgi:hypothetical protein